MIKDIDKNLEKIKNLILFTFIFSESIHNNNLLYQSPKYILEKYNQLIGFDPIVSDNGDLLSCDVNGNLIYTKDDDITFFHAYRKYWKSTKLVHRQLHYLKNTKDLSVIKMVKSFEKYIGPVNRIKLSNTSINYVLLDYLDKFYHVNKNDINIILRDMKIGELLKI